MAISVDCSASTLKGTGMGKCWEPPRPKVKRLSSRQKRLKFIREKNDYRLGMKKFRSAVTYCVEISPEDETNKLASLHACTLTEIKRRYKMSLRNAEYSSYNAQSGKNGEFKYVTAVLTLWN